MIKREEIIEYMQKITEDKDFVNSMWLNGSDAHDTLDNYSDIDVVFNVTEGYLDYLFDLLLYELDQKYGIDFRLDENYSDIKATCIHLKNTSSYLLIDLDVQMKGNSLTSNIEGENSKVIFDKNETNKYYEYTPDLDILYRFYYYNKGKMIQETRIEKNIKRGNFLEAYTKYMEYIVKPLLTIIRINYVPQWHYFGTCHINKHLPKEVVDQIISLYKVNDLEDIKKNMKKAKKMLKETEKDLEKKYGFDIKIIDYFK